MLHWGVSALAVMFTAYLVPGFKVRGFIWALVAAAVIGIANIFIWPLLILLTLPLNVLSLGLFTFVVNGAVIKICAALLPGFKVESWGAAILGAFVLSLSGTILHYYLA